MKKLKEKKGFTLVELIVVLVILAVLMVLLLPSLTGYIDKAQNKKYESQCRSIAVAAQTLANEKYAQGNSTGASLVNDGTEADPYIAAADLSALAEVAGLQYGAAASDGNKVIQITYASNKLSEVKYWVDGKTVTYSASGSITTE